MTNLHLLEAFDAVQRLNACRLIPMKHSYKVTKALRVLEPERAILDDMRNKLMEKYCKKGDDGKFVHQKVGDGFMVEFADPVEETGAAFNSEWSELMEQPAGVTITGIAIDDLRDDIPISGKDIELLVRIGVLLEAAPNGKKPKRKRAKKSDA